VLDYLPVSLMAVDAEGPFVAIDVSDKPGGGTGTVRPQIASLGAVARKSLLEGIRRSPNSPKR